MIGYGFSIWLLLNHQNISELKEAVGGIFMHVLHITLETNLETREEAEKALKKFPKKVNYNIDGILEFSEKMYKHDPLNAWIFQAKLTNVKTEFTPHVSVHYLADKKSPPKLKVKNIQGKGKVVIADTRSIFPDKWRFFT